MSDKNSEIEMEENADSSSESGDDMETEETTSLSEEE